VSALDEARERPQKGLMSSNELAELQELFEDTVVRIAETMRSGYAHAKPLKGENSPCKYCNMASICRSAEKEQY
jgi:ATP-dependent helicase/DNAse subunit B